MPSSSPTVALCMLVWDDEATIERCLRSVLGLIDYWVICDVGSSDRTTEIVADLLAPIPGELHHRRWHDFGHNRSELLERGRNKADFLLLLDPDMTVTRAGELGPLGHDAYLLAQPDSDTPVVPRFVRGNRRWWYEGSTHEVLATNGRYRQGTLDTIVVHQNDEGTRERTLLRRLDVLEREVAIGLDSPRTVLLLAETLRDVGRRSLAAEWFRRRKDLGEPHEVAYYANLQEGVLRADEDFLEAVPILLEAWQRHPARAEPLYELARGYRARGDAWLAYHFADAGLQVAPPTDALYVQRWVYEWGLRFERGWAAGRLGRLEEAKKDLHAVLTARGVPAEFVNTGRDWLANLGATHTLAAGIGSTPVPIGSLIDDVQVGRIVLDVSPDWPIFNPSIAADGDGFAMIVRSLNIIYDDGDLRFGDSAPRDINYLVTLNADLSVSEVRQIHDQPPNFRFHDVYTRGFQDLRLIRLGNHWFGVGNSWQLSASDACEAALLALDEATVVGVHRLAGPVPGRSEKNWMPFVHHGELHCVYSCGPTTIFRVDQDTGALSVAAERAAPSVASSLRGGSQGIELFGGGYLFVVHETYQSAGRRSYLHRFIRIGEDLRMEAMSPPFTFTDEVREFCAGAAINGSELVLSFGVRHSEAWLAVVPLEKAIGLLQPVEAPMAR